MRWEELFSDLEAQLEQAEAAELAGEVADRTRRELARIRLGDRLRSAEGMLTCQLLGAGQVAGRPLDVGPDWLLLADPAGRELLVCLSAVLAVTGLGTHAAEPETEGMVAGRLRLGHALRAIARDRATVTCVLGDGSVVTGTIDRVGADFVDLAEHDVDQPRRPGAVRAGRAIAFEGLALVRRA